MNNLIFKALGSILILSAPFLHGQQEHTGNPENGKRLYVQNGCYECHGYAGQGGAAGTHLAATPLSARAIIGYVRHPAGQMPPYTANVMTDNELTDVWAYLKTLPAPKPSKDIPLLSDSRSK